MWIQGAFRETGSTCKRWKRRVDCLGNHKDVGRAGEFMQRIWSLGE